MAGGLRYKFHGAQIKVLVGYAAESPSVAITGITKANPAVVTYSGADVIAEGDVVKITNVGGMTEVNDQVFIVGTVNTGSNTFELADTDSTGYGTYTSGGQFDVGEFSTLCELTNYNRQGGTSPEISATSACSTAQEYEIGLPDFGTTQIDFNFAPRTTVQGALHAFYLSGDVTAVKVILPKSGGNLVQLGFVQQESETAGVGGIFTASATIRNTGNRYDYL
jgi:Ubiquitin-activating enzyme E1 FCCH domain